MGEEGSGGSRGSNLSNTYIFDSHLQEMTVSESHCYLLALGAPAHCIGENMAETM